MEFVWAQSQCMPQTPKISSPPLLLSSPPSWRLILEGGGGTTVTKLFYPKGGEGCRLRILVAGS